MSGRRRHTKVPGHGLIGKGAPFDEDRKPIRIPGWNPRCQLPEPGRGLCECGVLSEVLPTGNARREWHLIHKDHSIRRDVNLALWGTPR